MDSAIENLNDRALLDLVQLRTFVTVCELGGFTSAARALGISQSTASLHIRRLESMLGCVLLLRSTHSVALTDRGDALLVIARAMLQANSRAFESVSPSVLRGRVRLGVSEDFVSTRLPEVLTAFRRDHPLVEIDLTVGLSGVLANKLEHRELDLMLGKRITGTGTGDLVFRDELIWLAHPNTTFDEEAVVPLLLYPAPSVSRAAALAALESAGRSWRVACTSGSLTGLVAAARAGLGVLAHARSLRPSKLHEVPGAAGLPKLPTVDFIAIARAPADPSTNALRSALQASQERLQAQAPNEFSLSARS